MKKRAAKAFIEIANDENYDAVWFARGGYGSCRVAEGRHGEVDGAIQAKGLHWLQ
jgi:muramoyltetrapeptide carboxypeptidase